MDDKTNRIYALFFDWVSKSPDAPALIDAKGTLSYFETAKRAAELSAALPADARRIGVVMEHSSSLILLLLAILKNGAAYIPAEPSFPTKRIDFMMEDARADLLITDQDPGRFSDCDIPVWSFSYLVEKAGDGDLYSYKEKPEDPAYILYTSGTTGKPKGVMVSSANVCHYARAFEHEFHSGPGDLMLQYSVCSFDIFTEEVFTTLLNGAALVIPNAEQKKDIHSLMQFIQDKGITIVSGFPYLLEQMNRLDSIPDSLHLLISGGDVLRESYVSNLRSKVHVYNTYGPAETTVCAAYCDCSHTSPLSDGTFPIGHPVLETQIVLLDENGKPVPDGEIGEICILGQGVSMGYTGDRKKENEAFRTTPDGQKIYFSGDLGRMLPDGNLAFLYRKDSQIMILGKRVETGEVENVLSRLPGIAMAAVRAFKDPMDLDYLIAYVVLEDPSLSLTSLRQGLAAELPDYMIPEFFVRMSALPYTPNGKVDTRALPVVMKEGALSQ